MGAEWVWTAGVAVALALAVLAAPARRRSDRPFWRPPEATSPELDMAYALDLLSLALAGGAPVVTSLSAVAQAVAGRETQDVLTRVSAGLQWGLDDTQAWASAPASWRPAAAAFALAGRAGAAPAQLLRRAADDVRVAENERVAAAGARAGVRIVLPLGLCFLPAFLLITVVPLVLGLVSLG